MTPDEAMQMLREKWPISDTCTDEFRSFKIAGKYITCDLPKGHEGNVHACDNDLAQGSWWHDEDGFRSIGMHIGPKPVEFQETVQLDSEAPRYKPGTIFGGWRGVRIVKGDKL